MKFEFGKFEFHLAVFQAKLEFENSSSLKENLLKLNLSLLDLSEIF